MGVGPGALDHPITQDKDSRTAAPSSTRKRSARRRFLSILSKLGSACSPLHEKNQLVVQI